MSRIRYRAPPASGHRRPKTRANRWIRSAPSRSPVPGRLVFRFVRQFALHFVGHPGRRAWPPVSAPSWNSQYSGGLKSGIGCVFLLLRRQHFFLPLPLLPVPSSVCFGRSLDRRAGRLVHGSGGGMGTGMGGYRAGNPVGRKGIPVWGPGPWKSFRHEPGVLEGAP